MELPKPEIYVIFTGERKNHPEYISLKDEFWGGDAVVDAKIKVIYDGQPGDIINQYVTFTRVTNDQMKKYGRTQKAAEETIRICINEDVLADYLIEKEVEVMDIMTALFDEEEVLISNIIIAIQPPQLIIRIKKSNHFFMANLWQSYRNSKSIIQIPSYTSFIQTISRLIIIP